jgi:uncharacterized protein
MKDIYNSDYFINSLELIPHPEGGYYKEIYRNPITSNFQNYPDNNRHLSTSIYYLLRSDNVSKFHQLLSDEIWYYHYGSSVNIYIIDQNGNLKIQKLGPQIEKGHMLQVIIKKGLIFGASIDNADSFSLFGCMVSPGFDFKDFKLISRQKLLEKYPQHKEAILHHT